jgi:hypothetical protein
MEVVGHRCWCLSVTLRTYLGTEAQVLVHDLVEQVATFRA